MIQGAKQNVSTSPSRAASRFAYWSPLWLCLLVPVAAWYSLLQLSGVALSDTPLAFVAVVPVLAGYLLIHDGRAPAASRQRSDPFIDSLIFLVLFLVCLVLLFVLPARLSWYFWLKRFDLLIVPIFATAVVIFFWGLGGAAVVRRSLLYLALVWPYPLALLNQALGQTLVDVSAAFGALAVRVLALPIAVSPTDYTRFVSTGPEKFTLIVADTCSGMNAMIGFLVIGLPLALTWSGRRWSKVNWLIVGALAAFLSNLLRLGILFYLSATAGIDFALGTVHPVLGTALFALVFVGMLWLARYFGLSFDVKRAVPAIKSQLAVRPESFRTRVFLVGFAAVVLAAGQTTLSQFGPLNADSLPATPVREAPALLPEMPGWSREPGEEIKWQNLYGRDSQSWTLVYRAGEASMVVQFVATPDQNLLDTYTLEQCNQFHGERVIGVSTVSLGHGISGRLIESQFDRGRERPLLNQNRLYWYMPLTVGGRLYHARIALFADTEMLPNQQRAQGQSQENPLVQLRDWLDSTFSPYPAAMSRPDFAEVDAYAIDFGRQMVEAIVSKSEGSSR